MTTVSNLFSTKRKRDKKEKKSLYDPQVPKFYFFSKFQDFFSRHAVYYNKGIYRTRKHVTPPTHILNFI